MNNERSVSNRGAVTPAESAAALADMAAKKKECAVPSLRYTAMPSGLPAPCSSSMHRLGMTELVVSGARSPTPMNRPRARSVVLLAASSLTKRNPAKLRNGCWKRPSCSRRITRAWHATAKRAISANTISIYSSACALKSVASPGRRIRSNTKVRGFDTRSHTLADREAACHLAALFEIMLDRRVDRASSQVATGVVNVKHQR